MKRLFTIMIAVLLTASVFSQAPQKMSYQAVIRNSLDQLVTNHAVGMRISILQGSSSGTVVYTETQTPTTNANGLVSIEIGGGAGFNTIDWSSAPYFLKTETDPAGGTNYTISGTSQLLSVPYALYAKTAASYPETDPVFGAWNKSSGINITASQVSDFQTNVTNNAAMLANTAKNSYPGADAAKLAAITGTNTGDETATTIKSKLGITTLSGSNTGDQTLAGLGGVASNTAITGATKTKITYDSKGLVTSGTDATTADVAASTDKNYVTDAQLTVIGNTSGTNSGDNAINTLYSGLVTNATHTGDVTGSGALTLATVNSNVGTFNNITINAKGLATAGSNVSYLTSETDPIFGAWNKSTGINITASQVSDFQTSVTNNAAVLLNTAKNSYPTADQTKLAGIAIGANVGVVPNTPITGSTKTKITYDSKGLVTSGTDATTADIAASTDKNYVTNAQLTVIGNTSGTNTGDETITTIKAKLGITTLSGSNTGDQTLASVLTQGTDAGNNKIINVNQQGIGTATPNSSSALEISSTTQGLLPPRMTQAQRDAITPVAGLQIFNTSTHRPNYYDGTEWQNFDGTSAKTLTVNIGDSYQGGIVAYLLQAGDPGYDAFILHGLIAAPSNLSGIIFYPWYNGIYTTTGATGTALGTGNTNTVSIVNSQGTLVGSYAALGCYNLELGGYSDWYLPSKDELNKLYLVKTTIGITNGDFWSSTEGNTNNAYVQDFGNGYMGTSDKKYTYNVRPIRAF